VAKPRDAARRGRIVLTIALLGFSASAAALTVALSRRGVDRLEMTGARLDETGAFSTARIRLQRAAFEQLPPYLSGGTVLVDDIRIQLQQARNLGPRLPADVLAAIDRLSTALGAPLVARGDLLAAAVLLERIVEAESEAQAQILTDAIYDIRRERTMVLVGLLATVALLSVLLWTTPQRVVAPLRPLLGFWFRGLMDQRRTALRLERLALAGEAAATLAHELRNPLAGVTLGLQNLERESEDLAPRVRPLVEELERVTRTLNEHLGAFKGPVEEASKVDVRRILTDLGELLRYEAPAGITVEIEAPVGLTCRTKNDRLRQVVLNLGLNGLHALEPAGRGRLRLEGWSDGSTLEIRVRDTGPGFPEAVLNGIQPPLSSASPSGSGLGLRIVRRAVAELGGSLKLSNPPDGGALVVVSLPCPGEVD